MDQDFNPEQLEMMKYVIFALLLIPALFIIRFLVYLITPRFILKLFHKKQGYKKEALKKEKKFYED
ncbi:MAG: hypothetical protein ACK4VI_01260 [Alphaproteobacteria bacterium]